jgi:hypothetical protein
MIPALRSRPAIKGVIKARFAIDMQVRLSGKCLKAGASRRNDRSGRRSTSGWKMLSAGSQKPVRRTGVVLTPKER